MKKYVRIVLQICILYLFSLLGSFIVQILHIKFPGSIVGLLLLLGCLHLKIIPVNIIKDGAGFLLGLLALFFVPSTVGVINYPELLSLNGILLVFSVIISTLLTIILTGRICQYLENRKLGEEDANDRG
ncbi:CidA/LrgA family holin-like protein [Psychrobacillus soli]|uniref:CidA/LrgA family holin-like protein n=1 Tax=Psychrobacillus soli TaxID=1543965 RepID=A0A544SPR1_9BACI|nr:CidA/LrgA family holin-like protein [Psychrobacillus soli]TQR07185.1 CidA/LrgA family holin-like protein [Psychrobacillus soli]